MEPLSREERETMKKNGRGVIDAEIDEYEQLIVQRHWQRTDSEMLLRHSVPGAEDRIQELYQKIYNKPGNSSQNTE